MGWDQGPAGGLTLGPRLPGQENRRKSRGSAGWALAKHQRLPILFLVWAQVSVAVSGLIPVEGRQEAAV